MKQVFKIFFIYFFLGLSVSLCSLGYAQTQTQPQTNKNIVVNAVGKTADTSIFKVGDANKELDNIHIKLSIQQLNIEDLKKAVSRLEYLRVQAQQCVLASNKELKLLEDELKIWEQAGKPYSTDSSYLINKQELLTRQSAECRFFILRSDETVTAFNDTIHRLSTSKIFAQSIPFWSYLQKSSVLVTYFDQIDWNGMVKASGITELNYQQSLAAILIILLLSVIISILVHKYEPPFLKVLTYNYLVPTFFFSLLSGCATLLFWHKTPMPAVVWLCYSFTGYVLTLSLLRFCLSSLLPSVSFFLSSHLRAALHVRTVILATTALSAYAIYVATANQFIPDPLIDLAQLLLIIFLSINIVSIAWLYNRVPHLTEKIPRLRVVANIFLLSMLAVILMTAFLGFDNLALFLLAAVGYSIIQTFIFFLLFRVMNRSIDDFNRGTSTLSKEIRNFLGVKPYKKLPELMLLRISGLVILFSIYLVGILTTWDFPQSTIGTLLNGFVNGFTLAHNEIVPLRLLVATILFAACIISGRSITNYIKKHVQFEGERDTQVAMASLTSYIIFAIALVVALIISGVNLTSLAIITGALSVGIGLGLQSIVNNFVSGIILLLERPIKPGDRIVIGSTEGFVKKIRIRSTQITTTTRSDVIVPNSDLITHQITNYMFKDPSCRIICPVWVAYSSDIVLVKQLLLQVAHNHKDVIKDAENPPRVNFKEFGEHNLLFELNCIIGDVNLKSSVKSDLNFAIAEIFKQHNLLLSPVEQRDITIKQWSTVLERKSDKSVAESE